MSEENTVDDQRQDIQSDYYGRDANGDMWVNMTELQRNGRVELHPIEPYGPSEVPVEYTGVRYTRGSPCIQFVLTSEGHEQVAHIEPANN